jgi:hypothetical protein
MKTWQILSTLACLGAIVFAADPTPPEKYEVLNGEGLAGSGFVIRHGEKFFGVASLHQFGGKAPSKLAPLEGDPVSLDKARVFKQKDVQVLPVLTPSPKLQFLAYNPDFTLQAGDEVILLNSLEQGVVVSGTLTARGMTEGSYKSSDGPRKLEVHTSKPFEAEGESGGPIIHKRTGTVIGVLLSADDQEKARFIGFETLCLAQLK